MTFYIFVTGGVISGLGKGITSASIGAILQAMNLHITIRKLDPYLNVDPGTMSPIEHGEVFVTDDGTEADLDLGSYERIAEIKTTQYNSTSSGKLYLNLLNKERRGDFLGHTIQIVPHFTNEIKAFITYDSAQYDVIICEIGGSIGDIEGMAFYEALSQLSHDLGREHLMFVHLTYLVYYAMTKELKTKPTQNAVRELRRAGIFPELLVCRTDYPMTEHVHSKLQPYAQYILEAPNVDSIYKVPLLFIRQNLHFIILRHFNIQRSIYMLKWHELVNHINKLTEEVNIAIVGKYVELTDSYKSLLETLEHAAIHHHRLLKTTWINVRTMSLKKIKETLTLVNGVVVPGGFGHTGIDCLLDTIQYIREKDMPFMGICLGMQLAVIEFYRNVVGIQNSGSTEFGHYDHPIIHKINPESQSLGGTMKLGATPIHLKPSTKTASFYPDSTISERHRHRYEINQYYKDSLQEHGLTVSGISEESIEIVELSEKPFYIGCQFHPEYQSTPFHPHPLLTAFVEKSIARKT